MLDYGFIGLDTGVVPNLFFILFYFFLGVVPNVDSVCTRMTSFADIGAAKLN